MFPHGQQQQIRLQLSQVLEAVLSQTLLPRLGKGRIAAFEIMLNNSMVRRLIREAKVFEIPSNIEMAKLEGMQTLDQTLANLVKENIVALEEAMLKSSNPAKLNQLQYSGKSTPTLH